MLVRFVAAVRRIVKALWSAALVTVVTLVSSAAAQEIAVTIAPGVFKTKDGVITMAPIADAATPKKVARRTQNDSHCLATAIYFEARGESEKGQKAVAEVILRRAETPGRPKTICGVVYEGSHRKTGCQFSFTCDGRSDAARPGRSWSKAKQIAAKALKTHGKAKAVVRGAIYYHADYVKPRWAAKMVRVAQIGSHIFYRPKGG